MVAKKTPSFPEYTPIGEEISAASALVQAAIALDRAGKYADEARDHEQLTQIAMVWIEMGNRLDGGSEEEGEEGDVTGEYPLGFASPGKDAEVKRKREESASKSKG